jgi:hypothetical protein
MFSEIWGVKVSWLYPGIGLKIKKGFYIGDTSKQSARVKFVSISRDMGWWSDFYPGEGEVLVYVGEKRSESGRLLREVLWRGNCRCVRPHDWRYLDVLNDEEDIDNLL